MLDSVRVSAAARLWLAVREAMSAADDLGDAPLVEHLNNLSDESDVIISDLVAHAVIEEITGEQGVVSVVREDGSILHLNIDGTAEAMT